MWVGKTTHGRLSVAAGQTWLTLDPASGATQPSPVDADGCVPIHLAPRETRLLLGSERQSEFGGRIERETG